MLKEVSAKTIVEGTTLFKDWDVPNPLQWKPSLDPESNEPFMPIPFEQAIKEGLFDKNIPILTGCTSEEGLVFSTPFLKSPRRWRMLFENWYHWAPLLFFNRYILSILLQYSNSIWIFPIVLVFCYQNCSDLLGEKIVLLIEKKFWNLRLKAENFQHFWDQLNNLFKQWKVRTIFGNRMLFLTCSCRFLIPNRLQQL